MDSFKTKGRYEKRVRQKRNFKLALFPTVQANLSKFKSSELLMEKLIMGAHGWPKFLLNTVLETFILQPANVSTCYM